MAKAWLLYAGATGSVAPGELVQETISFGAPGEGQILCEPLYGCWESNMSHALERSPIDICRYRCEPKVILGNAGVVRTLEVGTGVKGWRAGQLAIVSPNGVEDRWGYTVRAFGYDAPGTSGSLATLMIAGERQLVPIPEPTRYSLAQWAAFSARYVTAWSNWQMAYGVFRLQVEAELCPNPNVWGWGGGTTLAELHLARLCGCRTAMISGNDDNLAMIAASGITPVDRRGFGELSWDEERYRTDAAYRRSYRQSEESFLREVQHLTSHEMVQIFVDYIGGPVYRATLLALSREGVIATAGWKKGLQVTHSRAQECISRHQHVYTHYARYAHARDAVAYAEQSDWIPDPPQRIYAFDQIPQLARDYAMGQAGYFPCFSVNPT